MGRVCDGRGRRARLWWLALLPLAGCGPGQDPVGTPIDWWHGLEGGAIAEQRPPPPGVDDPYPHVGTTPARPTVPSKTVRDDLTASLAAQRTATHRLDVDQPIAPPVAVGGRPAMAGAAHSSQQSASATLDAAGSGPAAPLAASPGAPASVPPPPPPLKPVPTIAQQEAGEPVLAMPPPPAAVTVVTNGPLPQMPARPPPPPAFAGFAIPETKVGRLTPDYAPEAAHLANLDFVQGSDELTLPSKSLLDHLARSAAGKAVSVTGFGEARSDEPADQEAALQLGLARAAAAASELRRFGVASGKIKIAATPFGRGGDVLVRQ